VSVTRRQILAITLAAGATGATPVRVQAAGVDRLERLLAFEQRLESAYGAALEQAVIDPALGRSLLGQEREHVRGVEHALETLGRRGPVGSAPPPGPAALGSRRAFATFALELETETVAAYVGVLATLDAPGLLQPLGSIMASGAQHGVALRRVLGDPAVPTRSNVG
jgi:hypothetical protein